MPNDDCSPNTHNAALLTQIGDYVTRAIIAIQEQQPELLREKYRNIPWRSGRYQPGLTAKLTEGLSQTLDSDALIINLQKLLQALLIPDSFNSPILIELLTNIRSLKSTISQVNASNSSNKLESSDKQQPEITVLLLDAENLQLNPQTENFLATVCNSPIQVKIAFANWRSLGKLDAELHGRGYDLIHVPNGKDHADGKMIAVGLSIPEHYPKAKEVFVCSSDTVMTNLCNHLQKDGLTVYSVTKQGDDIKVLNCQNSKIQKYSLKSLPKIPAIEQIIKEIKKLIKAEQKSTNNQWVKLSRLSHLFKNKYQLTISQVVSHHFPGKKARDIFIDNPSEFVVHQTAEKSEMYITLFDLPQIQSLEPNNSVAESNLKAQSKASINSPIELEQVLLKILKSLTKNSANNSIPLEILAAKINHQYGEGITTILKRLQVDGNFTKFLQSSSAFKLEKNGKSYQVTLAQP